METTDKSLIEAHLSGDGSAFAELVNRYGDGMLGYLTKICGNRPQAEDFFQETFKRVHEKACTFRGGNFKSWLYTIATRVAFDTFRKQKKLRFISLNSVLDVNSDVSDISAVCVDENCPDPHEELEKAEIRTQVRNALNKLPHKQRATLVLAYYQQLSYAQVADVLECSIGTVKTQMFRALKMLAIHLPEFAGGVK
ncbi:MAG: RNA polymerase sigma factor [Planctomycetes bacterium]|nr:RNA polymerase sigma factor [Planctomycetota bacterium]